MVIRDFVRIHAYRVENDEHTHVPLDLEAERLNGDLLHPVPLLEMCDRFGLNRRGWKIVARWPDSVKTYQLELDDVLEAEGRRYRVLGVRQHRPCYLEVFVDEW